MLVTNQRLNQLAAAKADFVNRGMLDGSCMSLSESFDDIDGRTLLAQTATPVIGPEAMAAPP